MDVETFASSFEAATLLRLAYLYAHIVAVSLATGVIVLQDVALMRSSHLDHVQLRRTAHVVKGSLAALWITGSAIIWIDTGLDPETLLLKPKLLAKLAIVVALTINGALLHAIAFPILMSPKAPTMGRATICAILGGISTASWLYAAFLGLARPLEVVLGLSGFLALYGLVLTGATAVAITHARHIVFALMTNTHGLSGVDRTVDSNEAVAAGAPPRTASAWSDGPASASEATGALRT